VHGTEADVLAGNPAVLNPAWAPALSPAGPVTLMTYRTTSLFFTEPLGRRAANVCVFRDETSISLNRTISR
jgi:hypothetical protein